MAEKDKEKAELDELFTPDTQEGETIDSIVWILSRGDIIAAKNIFQNITMAEALEWIVIAERNSNE